MTEDEAKTKWCPFANQGEVTAFRVVTAAGVGSSQHTLCIGSACMAWRWSEARRSVAFLEAVQAHMKTSAKPNFNTSVQAVFAEKGSKFERAEGDCGLAGAPQ